MNESKILVLSYHKMPIDDYKTLATSYDIDFVILAFIMNASINVN